MQLQRRHTSGPVGQWPPLTAIVQQEIYNWSISKFMYHSCTFTGNVLYSDHSTSYRKAVCMQIFLRSYDLANRQWLQSYDCSPCTAQGRALAVLQECSSLAVAGLPPYATRIRADSCSGPAASTGRQRGLLGQGWHGGGQVHRPVHCWRAARVFRYLCSPPAALHGGVRCVQG